MNYLNQEITEFQDATHHRRPPRLSLQQQTIIMKFVEDANLSASEGRLQGIDVSSLK